MKAKLRSVLSVVAKWKKGSYPEHHTGKLEKACGEKVIESLHADAKTVVM